MSRPRGLSSTCPVRAPRLGPHRRRRHRPARRGQAPRCRRPRPGCNETGRSASGALPPKCRGGRAVLPGHRCQEHNVLPVGRPIFMSDRSTRFISLFKPLVRLTRALGREQTQLLKSEWGARRGGPTHSLPTMRTTAATQFHGVRAVMSRRDWQRARRSRVAGQDHPVGQCDEAGGQHDEHSRLDSLEGPEPIRRLVGEQSAIRSDICRIRKQPGASR